MPAPDLPASYEQGRQTHPTHTYSTSSPLAQQASQLAADLLQHEHTRWVHTCAVVARAGEGAGVLPPPQRALLLAAAWLHDVGYADPVTHAMAATRVGASGFHPLDGARYLTVHGWPREVATLVAHHSGAAHVAAVLGLGEQIRAYVITTHLAAVADTLTWADQTTGPAGQAWTITDRMSEMLHRLGPTSPTVLAHPHRVGELTAAVERTEHRRSQTTHIGAVRRLR